MTQLRSIRRDIDIRFYSSVIAECLEAIEESFNTLRDVGYEPADQLVEMERLCKRLIQESSIA